MANGELARKSLGRAQALNVAEADSGQVARRWVWESTLLSWPTVDSDRKVTVARLREDKHKHTQRFGATLEHSGNFPATHATSASAFPDTTHSSRSTIQ